MGFSISAFNKAGARLLQKQTGIKLEKQIINLGGEPMSLGFKRVQGVKPPENAATASFVQGERKFGQESFDIVTFFDKEGKIIQRHRFVKPINEQGRRLESVSDYRRTPVSTSTYQGKTTVLSESFQCRTQAFKPDGKIKSDSFSALGIDYQKGVYTKTDSELLPACIGFFESAGRNYKTPATLHLADVFKTKIQQWGKQLSKKSYETEIIYNPSTGTFAPIYSKGQNLTKNEIDLLKQDKYIPLRFHPKLNSVEYMKKEAFAQQQIPLDTKIEFEQISKETKKTAAGYVSDNDPTTIHIIYREGCQQHPATIHTTADILNHEGRHVWQHQLVEALDKNQITDPHLKKLAESLKEAFSKPRINPDKDLDGYMNQFHEKDAYNIGDAACDAVYQGYDNLRQIFKNIMAT